ncbi:DNA repair protein RecO [Roseofilum casamattae]|uniref:DNA repair protein RecO n=1 Tax=Roseofilum casamattae BLCC-M143 TaxID=3022442 RepID=A0ABT7BXP2_9CYAN|nr:DNA repair protein RecO [Roseofilum casamattae]MDJ1183959.1 DNA repair protein RecO [Roseofilum casamattae BLCC-M143]
MSKTYKATGINLKAMAMGESDRLLTILTSEHGLIRAIAPGARKAKSSLGGRSGLFVVNSLLLAKGRSLDKVTQAQTVKSYAKLSQHLLKLTASQYLAELVLCQANERSPQPELYDLLLVHLDRLEACDLSLTLAHLTQGIFHLLALAGLAPQVHQCCVTGKAIVPNLSDPDWQVKFNLASGGLVTKTRSGQSPQVKESGSPYQVHSDRPLSPARAIEFSLSGHGVWMLQHLAESELPSLDTNPQSLWPHLERLLRAYSQYHFDRPIRAAALIDTCLEARSPSEDIYS